MYSDVNTHSPVNVFDETCWLESAAFARREGIDIFFWVHVFLTDFFGAAMAANWNTCSEGTEAENIAKIDARLHAMMQTLNFHQRTMARLGELGVTTVQALNTLCDDRAGVRKFLHSACGIDPEGGNFLHSLEAGKVISAWEQSAKRVEVDNKRDAERLASNLPPQIHGEEIQLLKKKFEATYNKGRTISKAFVPSKPYLELKIGHAETMWAAERLTEVTSFCRAERHAQRNNGGKKEWQLDDGDSISFKVTTKPFGIPMPEDSETLRARLRLMANTFLFLKLKFPQKGVLATCTRAVWDDYIEYLFGDTVWGFTTRGPDGRPAACPHQGIVEGYDLALREKVADLMANGTDIENAFELAMNDKELKYTSFLCYFTTEVATSRCRALTAPAFRDIHGPGSQAPKRQLAITDGSEEPQLSKRQKKAAAKKAAKEKAAPAASNGNGGNTGKSKKGAGKGKKGKTLALQNGGVGDARAKLKQKTTSACSLGADLQICFAWNNGQQCKKSPCTFAHACQICEGLHPKGECSQNRG